MRVSPFRHLRIVGYLPLPAAFRSLSRLSSAPSAKASALRLFPLNLSRPGHCLAARLPALPFMAPFLSRLAWRYSVFFTVPLPLPRFLSHFFSMFRCLVLVLFDIRFSRYKLIHYRLFYQPSKTKTHYDIVLIFHHW